METFLACSVFSLGLGFENFLGFEIFVAKMGELNQLGAYDRKQISLCYRTHAGKNVQPYSGNRNSLTNLHECLITCNSTERCSIDEEVVSDNLGFTTEYLTQSLFLAIQKSLFMLLCYPRRIARIKFIFTLI